MDAQDRIRERQIKNDAALEGVPFECRKFSAEIVDRTILIRQSLHRVTANLEFLKALEAAKRLLDSVQWKAKFTTGLVGGPDKRRDSLYYMTPEGISLRLKMFNAESGDIKQVIQSFAEMIFFEDDNNNIYLNPRLGLTVQEYASPEFLAIQDGGVTRSGFESKIRIYREGDHIILIRNVPNGRSHTGNKVNAIL